MNLDTYLNNNQIKKANFAKAIGVSVQALYRYLSGDRTPRPAIIRRIKRATNGEVTANSFIK